MARRANLARSDDLRAHLLRSARTARAWNLARAAETIETERLPNSARTFSPEPLPAMGSQARTNGTFLDAPTCQGMILESASSRMNPLMDTRQKLLPRWGRG